MTALPVRATVQALAEGPNVGNNPFVLARLFREPNDFAVRLELDRFPGFEGEQTVWLHRFMLGFGMLRPTVGGMALFGPAPEFPGYFRLVTACGMRMLLRAEVMRRFMTDVDLSVLGEELPVFAGDPA